ncbi:MAG: replication-associated recombination protein A [Deltaproteobacteria bacterium]|jgi:putative ATPase|nr:replication-associated recombination protein A [Deltaproteobacteria bacterium]
MPLFPPSPPAEPRGRKARPAADPGGDGADPALAPLAQRLRPRTIEEFAGQRHLLGEGRLLRLLYESGRVASLILWGPPGTGKTSLARLLTRKADAAFVEFSAVLSGIKDVREVVLRARETRKLAGRPTVLFVDEIHRFNKAQQDAFLPHVESGLITLIGATTENPSFEIIPALVSRARVLVLEPLSRPELEGIMDLALADGERGLGRLGLAVEPRARDFLVMSSGGDARSLLNALELSAELACRAAGRAGREGEGVGGPGGGGTGGVITEAVVSEAVQRKAWRYDKGGEEHYNLISAVHKSLRDSDPDGALYWIARMLEGGEDPVYLLRRMIRFASEDVGEADPESLVLGVSALESYRLLGSPEGDLALAQLAVHLALAPKSNAVYKAFGRARSDARTRGPLPVPLHIRNAPTRLMKELGYGRGYQYAHDFPDAETDQEHLPDELLGEEYYRPGQRGREKAYGPPLRARRARLSLKRAEEESQAGPPVAGTGFPEALEDFPYGPGDPDVPDDPDDTGGYPEDPGLPAGPGAPEVTGDLDFPGVPEVSSVPGDQEVSGVLDVPGDQEVSGVQDDPGDPDVPGIQDYPGDPDEPGGCPEDPERLPSGPAAGDLPEDPGGRRAGTVAAGLPAGTGNEDGGHGAGAAAGATPGHPAPPGNTPGARGRSRSGKAGR